VKAFRWSALALAVVCGASTFTMAQQPNPWWRDPDVQRQLDLTSAQIEEIDARFRETLDERRRMRADADKADADLADALTRGDLSDADAEALASRVARAQAVRNEARTRVLLRMYKVLSPQQRTQLTSLRPPRR
jgi:Spy/CpxP family protein refolding chaperone